MVRHGNGGTHIHESCIMIIVHIHSAQGIFCVFVCCVMIESIGLYALIRACVPNECAENVIGTGEQLEIMNRQFADCCCVRAIAINTRAHQTAQQQHTSASVCLFHFATQKLRQTNERQPAHYCPSLSNCDVCNNSARILRVGWGEPPHPGEWLN